MKKQTPECGAYFAHWRAIPRR